jgi:energy-coupling factor transporter ATP-binding protein EcfA2
VYPVQSGRAGRSAPGGLWADSSLPSGVAASLRGASRAFGPRTVLDRLELDIADGEFVALIGRSGSGKSTLLRALARLDREVTGSVEVRGPVAVAFQEPRLVPWKRVLANASLGLRVPSPDEPPVPSPDEMAAPTAARTHSRSRPSRRSQTRRRPRPSRSTCRRLTRPTSGRRPIRMPGLSPGARRQGCPLT